MHAISLSDVYDAGAVRSPKHGSYSTTKVKNDGDVHFEGASPSWQGLFFKSDTPAF